MVPVEVPIYEDFSGPQNHNPVTLIINTLTRPSCLSDLSVAGVSSLPLAMPWPSRSFESVRSGGSPFRIWLLGLGVQGLALLRFRVLGFRGSGLGSRDESL